VLLVTGSGIQGISPAAGSRAYGAPQAGSPDVYRVVAVNTAPGELRFRVEVADVGADLPVATVLEAVDEQNQPVPSPGVYEVRFSR
jgi:hypothetical protein